MVSLSAWQSLQPRGITEAVLDQRRRAEKLYIINLIAVIALVIIHRAL